MATPEEIERFMGSLRGDPGESQGAGRLAGIYPSPMEAGAAQPSMDLLEALRAGGGQPIGPVESFLGGLSEGILPQGLRLIGAEPGFLARQREGFERRTAARGRVVEGFGLEQGYGERAGMAVGGTFGALAGDLPAFWSGGPAVASLRLGTRLTRALSAARFARGATSTAIRTHEIATAMTNSAALFGATGVIRETLRQANGEEPFNVSKILAAGAKEGSLGVLFGRAAAATTAGRRLGGEIATFALGGPAMEGRLPGFEDVVSAGAMVFGLRGLDRVMAAATDQGAARKLARDVADAEALERQLPGGDLEIVNGMAEWFMKSAGEEAKANPAWARAMRAEAVRHAHRDPDGFRRQFGDLVKTRRDALARADTERTRAGKLAKFERENLAASGAPAAPEESAPPASSPGPAAAPPEPPRAGAGPARAPEATPPTIEALPVKAPSDQPPMVPAEREPGVPDFAPRGDGAAPRAELGREGALRQPTGGSYRYRYALMELDDLVPSHDPTRGFAESKGYPTAGQEKNYRTSATLQDAVRADAKTFDPSFIWTDSPDATHGPSIVTPDRIARGGNRRLMVQRLVEQAEPGRLKREATERAAALGFTPEQVAGFERPVPVRVLLERPTTPESELSLSRVLNESATAQPRLRDQGASRAAKLSNDAIGEIAGVLGAEGEGTLRQAIRDSKAIPKILERAQVWTRGERDLFITPDGLLTKQGLDLFDELVIGRLVPDRAVRGALSAETAEKVLRVAPGALRAESHLPGVVAPLLEKAIASEQRRQAEGIQLDDFLRQQAMDPAPSQVDPRVAALHRWLAPGGKRGWGGATPTEAARVFDSFAARIEEIATGQGSLLGGEATPEQAFTETFGQVPARFRRGAEAELVSENLAIYRPTLMSEVPIREPEDMGLRPALLAEDGGVIHGKPRESWSALAERQGVALAKVRSYGYVDPSGRFLWPGDAAAEVLAARRRQIGVRDLEIDAMYRRMAEEQARQELFRDRGENPTPEAVREQFELEFDRPAEAPDPLEYLRPGGHQKFLVDQARAERVTRENTQRLMAGVWPHRLEIAGGRSDSPIREGDVLTIGGGLRDALSPARHEIVNRMVRDGEVRVRGLRLQTPVDMAVAGQVFGRNPWYEVLHYIGLRDGKIVGVRSITSRHPSAVSILGMTGEEAARLQHLRRTSANEAASYEASLFERELRRIGEWAQKVGANEFFHLHNHPSGVAASSRDDLSVHRWLTKNQERTGARGLKLRGGIILNHRHFGWIDPDGTPHIVPLPSEVTRAGDLRSIPEVRNQLLGAFVGSDPARASVAETVASLYGTGERIATVLYLDPNVRLSGIQQLPVEWFMDGSARGERFIATERDRFGATYMAAFYDGARPDAVRALQQAGVFNGVIYRLGSKLDEKPGIGASPREGARGYEEISGRRGRGSSRAPAEIREPSEPYELAGGVREVPLRYEGPVGQDVPVPKDSPLEARYASTWAAGAANLRREMLAKYAGEVERGRRSKMSREQISELARAIQLSPEDVERLTGRQGLLLPVELQERIVVEWRRGYDEVRRIKDEIASAKNRGDEPGRAQLEAELEATADAMGKLYVAAQVTASEAGRTLGARAGGRRSTQEKLIGIAIKQVMDERRLPKETAEQLVREIIEGAGDAKSLRLAIEKAYFPDLWDKLFELRVMMLLSSPVTQLRNTAGNSFAAAARMLETSFGVAYDWGFHVLTAGRAPRQRHVAEVYWDALGVWQGIREGVPLMLQAIRSDEVSSQVGRVSEQAVRGRAIRPDVGGLGLSRFPTLNALQEPVGRFVRFPGRFLAASDLMFTTVNRMGEVYRRSAREVYTGEATRQLVGVDRAAKIMELVGEARKVSDDRIAQVARSLDRAKTTAERIAGAAENKAREFTFRSELSGFLRKIDSVRFDTYRDEEGRTRKTGVGIFSRFMVPFLPTPLNLLRFNLERAPGLSMVQRRNRVFMRMLRDPAKATSEDVVDAWARMSLGGTMFAFLTQLAAEGLVTGAPPNDKDAKSFWERFTQPFSIRVPVADERGGKEWAWVSYLGLSPMTEILAMAAEAVDAYQRRGEVATEERAIRVAFAMSSTFFDQPFLTGFSDLVLALTDPRMGEHRGATLATNLVSGLLVPRGVAFAARAIDPTQRAFAETVQDRLLQETPFLRAHSIPFRDAIGRKIEREGLWRALNAMAYAKPGPNTDKVDALLWHASDMPDRAIINYPSRSWLGRRLSAEAYDDLLRVKGELLMPLLERLADSPLAQRAARDPVGRLELRQMIQGLESEATQRAVLQVVPAYELQQLGLPVTDSYRARVANVLLTSQTRDVYSHRETTTQEKHQILATGGLTRAQHEARQREVGDLR